MKLMRVGPAGQEKPAVLIGDDTYVDVSDVVADYNGSFLSGGVHRQLGALVADRAAQSSGVTRRDVRIGAPIARPHQILGIGLNYRDHAAETRQALPTEPVVFNKAPNTLVGPTDDVWIPRGAGKTDWEVELGVVVGTRCRYLANEAEAAEAIAGFVIVNDISERAFQLERGGQWVKGKSAETFNPCGPYLVTPDELEDVHALDMWLDVNGTRRQSSSTAHMVFGVYRIIHHLSQFMVLEPGDLINTGTPAGVGMAQDPPAWLQPGDVMELGIAGLGVQRQEVHDAP